MELQSTVQELYAATKRLDKASKQIFKLAEQKAVTENAYRMELSKAIMKERAEGTPATLIGDICRGQVAYLKLERDLAADTYKSAISAMEALKAQINALQSIARYQSDI